MTAAADGATEQHKKAPNRIGAEDTACRPVGGLSVSECAAVRVARRHGGAAIPRRVGAVMQVLARGAHVKRIIAGRQGISAMAVDVERVVGARPRRRQPDHATLERNPFALVNGSPQPTCRPARTCFVGKRGTQGAGRACWPTIPRASPARRAPHAGHARRCQCAPTLHVARDCVREVVPAQRDPSM